MFKLFIQLSEGDKRILFALLLVFVLVFILIGFIGKLIQVIMRRQGERIDDQINVAVRLNVIKNKKHFISYADKKNWRIFFMKSWVPILIILAGVLTLIIHNAISGNWSYDVWDYQTTGIGTWFFIWDFTDPSAWTTVFGIPVLSSWPPLISMPHWSWEAWASYIFIICVFFGGGWYLFNVQAVIARFIRIRKLAKSIYSPKLDDYHYTDGFTQSSNSNNVDNNQPNQ